MENKEIFLSTYFPDFIVLDSSFNLLKQYIEGHKLNEREKCRKIIQINNLICITYLSITDDILSSIGLKLRVP